MKKVIEGKTYDTEASAVMAEGLWEYQGAAPDAPNKDTRETTLYQNREGAFFAVGKETTYHPVGRKGGAKAGITYDWIVMKDTDEAWRFAKREELTNTRDIGAWDNGRSNVSDVIGKQMRTIYLRVPPSLKAAIEKHADATFQSVNTFVMRCIEAMLAKDEDAKHMAEVRAKGWLVNEKEFEGIKAKKEAAREASVSTPKTRASARAEMIRAGALPKPKAKRAA